MKGDGANPVWWIFRRFGREDRHLFVVGLVTGLLGQLAIVAPPLILGKSIDIVFGTAAASSLPLVPASWIPESGEGLILAFGGAIALAGLLGFGLVFSSRASSTLFAQRTMFRLRSGVYDELQSLDMSFFDDRETGDIMSRLNNDVQQLQRFLVRGVERGLRTIFVTTAIAAVFFLLHWPLALVSLLVAPLVGVMTVAFVRLIRPRVVNLRRTVGHFNAKLQNKIDGMEVIKSSGAEEAESRKFRDEARSLFEAWWRTLLLQVSFVPTLRFVSATSFALTFVVGGFWLLDVTYLFSPPELTVGTFLIFLFLNQRLTRPFTEIGQVFFWYEDARASGGRIMEIWATRPEIERPESRVPIDDIAGHVEMRDVTFAYETRTPVLRDIDLDVEPGETIGIVGPTGAGKSTLVKLILRLYDPDDGTVSVDGTDLRWIDPDEIREVIGYVSQDPFLFDGTVVENIRYGAFDASEEEVIEAARTAKADAFIRDLPDGYETQVGERGVKLSGGQRQRICIARSVLQAPSLWILDEATSDVDAETELLIQESLETFYNDQTSFVVAHRLSTVKKADRILVLDEGEIVERGGHEELLSEGGIYADLWNIQTGEREKVTDAFNEFIPREKRSSVPRADSDRESGSS